MPSEVIKLVKAWAAERCPDDLTVASDVFFEESPPRPGGVERFFPDAQGCWHVEQFLSDNSLSLPGIYFVEQGETFSEDRRLAGKGRTDARVNLGNVYHEAETIIIKFGGPSCHFNLGVGYAYNSGLGVPRDHTEAAEWFRKGAEQGHPAAQCSLGLAHYYGQGVPQDFVQAHMWLSLAVSRAGRDDQKEWLSYRNQVAERMTPQQIIEAQRLAQLESQRLGAR
jgi:hypothetical protein